MKFALKSIAAVAAFVAVGAAHADVTLPAGGTVTGGDWKLSELAGSGTLSFSKSLLTALNAGGIDVVKVAPAEVNITKSGSKYTSVAAAAPVTSLTGDVSGNTLQVNAVGTAGGALQTAVADDLTNEGGSLSISNIFVDLGTKAVYADVVGEHGVGEKLHLHVWDFTNITGATSATLVEGTNQAVNQLTGLKITTEGFDAFTTSLGLLEAGVSALKRVSDFGVIDSKITFTAQPVPEPSTYALMALGLVGMGVVARRRAK